MRCKECGELMYWERDLFKDHKWTSQWFCPKCGLIDYQLNTPQRKKKKK